MHRVNGTNELPSNCVSYSTIVNGHHNFTFIITSELQLETALVKLLSVLNPDVPHLLHVSLGDFPSLLGWNKGNIHYFSRRPFGWRIISTQTYLLVRTLLLRGAVGGEHTIRHRIFELGEEEGHDKGVEQTIAPAWKTRAIRTFVCFPSGANGNKHLTVEEVGVVLQHDGRDRGYPKSFRAKRQMLSTHLVFKVIKLQCQGMLLSAFARSTLQYEEVGVVICLVIEGFYHICRKKIAVSGDGMTFQHCF